MIDEVNIVFDSDTLEVRINKFDTQRPLINMVSRVLRRETSELFGVSIMIVQAVLD